MVEILNKDIDNYWDIPFVGTWPLKIGKIIELTATPCTPSPQIWAKAFWHDIPWLVWAVIKPDPVDLVLERFGTRHKFKRRRRFQIVEKVLPQIPVPKGAIGRAVFPVIQAQQKLGWYLLIVDATLDFAINWTSTAYQWEGCAVPDAYWCNGRAVSKTTIIPKDIEVELPIWDDRNQHGFFATISSMETDPGYDVSCNATLQYRTLPPDDPHHFNAPLRLVDTKQGIDYGIATPHENGDGSFNVSWGTKDWSIDKPDHSFVIRTISSNVAHANFEGSFIEVYGHKQKGLKWDP